MNPRPLAIVQDGRLIPLDENGYPVRPSPLPALADANTLVLTDVAHALREASSRMTGLRDLSCDIAVDAHGAKLHFRAIA